MVTCTLVYVCVGGVDVTSYLGYTLEIGLRCWNYYQTFIVADVEPVRRYCYYNLVHQNNGNYKPEERSFEIRPEHQWNRIISGSCYDKMRKETHISEQGLWVQIKDITNCMW